jgi:hypothetical protein
VHSWLDSEVFGCEVAGRLSLIGNDDVPVLLMFATTLLLFEHMLFGTCSLSVCFAGATHFGSCCSQQAAARSIWLASGWSVCVCDPI